MVPYIYAYTYIEICMDLDMYGHYWVYLTTPTSDKPIFTQALMLSIKGSVFDGWPLLTIVRSEPRSGELEADSGPRKSCGVSNNMDWETSSFI